MNRESSLLAFALLAAPASAADWIVDATGSTSSLTNITQAMAVAQPGDRILVQPGSYPAFQFSRGVEVIGLGSDPSQVVVQSVGFHPTIPTQGWDTALVNMTVCGDPGWGGNELASGTLVVDSVVSCGGIFLHGAGQLYLLVIDNSIDPSPGDGFQGAALDFSGGVADIVNTRIRAASASASDGLQAGVGLRIGAGSTVRISDSQISGGSGDHAGDASFLDGGEAMVKAYGTAAVNLRLSGATLVLGGAGVESGAGGAAVDVGGTILVGDATVYGGAGNTLGADYASSGPTLLGYDPHLQITPHLQFGAGDAFVHAGDHIFFHTDSSLSSPTLGSAGTLDPPSAPLFSPLVAGGGVQYLSAADFGFRVPRSMTPVTNHMPRRRIYFQAFFTDPSASALLSTNPVAITIAP